MFKPLTPAQLKLEEELTILFNPPKKKKRRVTKIDELAIKYGIKYWLNIEVDSDEKSERFDWNMLGFDYIDWYINVLQKANPGIPLVHLQKLLRTKLPWFKIDGMVLSSISRFGYSILPRKKATSELSRRKGIRKYRPDRDYPEHW